MTKIKHTKSRIIKMANLSLIAGEDDPAALPVGDLLWILEDGYLLTYLPKQGLKQLVNAEENSKRAWR